MNIANTPVLETGRLRLRGLGRDDLAASAAMWAAPDVVRHISGRPSTRQESWARLLRHVGHWALFGFGYWAVEERATGGFVGEVGLAHFERAIEPPLDGIPEVGWVLAPEAHGRGLATEAVAAALTWADTTLPHLRTACIIAPGNTASIRVANKSGYRAWTTTTYLGEPTLMLERPRGG